ncbi:glycosyltransferase family 2 protein [Sphaerotilus mobilis]|uniref:GT2 family glycosyltransferase n=1 Tax=Sphaerotilus mobilis TaxID=47994 RepID=A0A4Q7LTA1_9BURK|nr:glycosyltransferase family 2 protein [Sphaerotilus mobilis]RZS58195.1 GT2 family glycosyltransferase [Sphaerotilus mobilis]
MIRATVGSYQDDRRKSICFLLTCFNRRSKTISCLRSLVKCVDLDDFLICSVLVDDGSTDGTAEAVAAEFPWVTVISHVGAPLFWCRGMAMAMSEAIKDSHDYYVLINDDTVLYPASVSSLLDVYKSSSLDESRPPIIVGSTRDPLTKVLTYGGQIRKSGASRTRFEKIHPADHVQEVDTFNGNIVLLPAAVVSSVGTLDHRFEHALGDLDYGLRARALGFSVLLAPGFHGECSNNPVSGTFLDSSLPFAIRWKLLLGRKGLPWRSWMIFTRRHAGLFWWAYFAWPYLRLICDASLIRSSR